MKKVIIDGALITDRAALHTVFSQELALPDYYGKNLDALHDCLTDLGEDAEIVIRDFKALEENLGKYAHAFVHMLHDCMRSSEHIKITIE